MYMTQVWASLRPWNLWGKDTRAQRKATPLEGMPGDRAGIQERQRCLRTKLTRVQWLELDTNRNKNPQWHVSPINTDICKEIPTSPLIKSQSRFKFSHHWTYQHAGFSNVSLPGNKPLNQSYWRRATVSLKHHWFSGWFQSKLPFC